MTRHLVHASPTPRAGPAAGRRRPALPRAARRRPRLRRAARARAPPRDPARHAARRQRRPRRAHARHPRTRRNARRRPARTARALPPRRRRAATATGSRDLLAHAERIVAGAYARRPSAGSSREEAFVGVAPRTQPRGSKHAVAATRFLWVDVDRPDRLDALWSLLAERPCHLLIESGGSGGVHAYWKLDAAARPPPPPRPTARSPSRSSAPTSD